MEDFALKVTKGSQVVQIENLKSTSTVKEMVRQIKRKYRVSNYGAFCLQNRFGVVIYVDEENNDSNETLEIFFGNCIGADIIYEPVTAGFPWDSKKSILIWNALKKPVKCFYKYKIDNVFQTEKHHKGNIGVKVEVAKGGGGGDLGFDTTIKQEKNGPSNKSGEFDIAPRDFAKVRFEVQAIKGTVADCTISFDDGQEVKLPPSKKGQSFIIFKDTGSGKFVAAAADYCSNKKKFDWKTQSGKEISESGEC